MAQKGNVNIGLTQIPLPRNGDGNGGKCGESCDGRNGEGSRIESVDGVVKEEVGFEFIRGLKNVIL
jgi:hypothetical protein